MSVTAALVKELREKSGAGMMDCKKALGETDGDMDAAIDWLRTKGLAAAAKKSGRVAAEGLVAIAVDGTKGAVVELNAETDFVSRNSEFQGFASTLAALALSVDDLDEFRHEFHTREVNSQPFYKMFRGQHRGGRFDSVEDVPTNRARELGVH